MTEASSQSKAQYGGGEMSTAANIASESDFQRLKTPHP